MGITIVYGNILAAWLCFLIITLLIMAYDTIIVIILLYQMPKNTAFITMQIVIDVCFFPIPIALYSMQELRYMTKISKYQS